MVRRKMISFDGFGSGYSFDWNKEAKIIAFQEGEWCEHWIGGKSNLYVKINISETFNFEKPLIKCECRPVDIRLPSKCKNKFPATETVLREIFLNKFTLRL